MGTLLASALAETNAKIVRVTSNWYWFVIAGLVFLMGGFIAIFRPVLASFTVEALIALFFIVGGILQTLQLLRAARSSSFIWSLLLGILFIALGVILLTNPTAGLSSLTLLIVVLLAASGITKIIYAFKLRPLNGWIWMLISGLISLLLAFLLMNHWAASVALTLGVLLAIELVSSGLWLLLIGFSFRKLYTEIRA